ncbi:MAG: glycosyltransferase family 2 protein [Candidatus Gottesmanbacteria bacterium]|nr:glycosyltransferase family 2 protein [Candidatus Gottesmanbacteria bacterium]
MTNVKKPSVNIVIPVYNEEKELAQSIRTLAEYLRVNLTDFTWHITIADNASTDTTLQIGRRISKLYPQVAVIHLPQKGRGRAVKFAWQRGDFDVVAYMDVDLSTDLKHLPPLVRSLNRGYDIAIGTRNANDSRVYGRSLLRTITSKMYILLIKLFFFVHFSDAQCGFKAVTRRVVRDIIPKIKDNKWFFDTELLVIAEKMGYRIYEEPVTWTDNPGSTVRVMKTAQGDLAGLWRLFKTRPWTYVWKK